MRSFAITSGKGGVGKTSISTNLGISLARRGKRVLLFDADLGLANLDVMLGVKPKATLEQVISGQVRLAEAVTEGPGGVRFIAGGSGIDALVHLNERHLNMFLAELTALETEFDLLLFDTGAGVDDGVMTFLQAADEVVLVVTPDPSSLVDAYAAAKLLWAQSPNAKVRVVANMVSGEAEARSVHARLYSIAKQYLDKAPQYGGCIRMDPRAAACVRRRRPYVLDDPNCAGSRDIEAVATALFGSPYVAPAVGLADRFLSLFSRNANRAA